MKFFSYIKTGDVHLNSESKVIPAEEFCQLLASIEILEKAKQEALQYKREVELECEELRKVAKDEGFAEGLSQFNDHLISFENSLKQIRHEMHRQILPIALRAAKKIVNKELELFPETIVDIVLQALAPAKQNHKLTIYVNKADKEALEANKGKIKEVLEQLQSLSIQEREDITEGGCIIETETGIINASIENQWRSLEAAFAKYMK